MPKTNLDAQRSKVKPELTEEQAQKITRIRLFLDTDAAMDAVLDAMAPRRGEAFTEVLKNQNVRGRYEH